MATKGLIFALMVIAGAVFVAQVMRWPGAFVGVSIYWGVLTIKNFIDWRRSQK